MTSISSNSLVGRTCFKRVMSNKINGEEVVVYIYVPLKIDDDHWSSILQIFVSGEEVYSLNPAGVDELQSLLLSIEAARIYLDESGLDIEWKPFIKSHGFPYYEMIYTNTPYAP